MNLLRSHNHRLELSLFQVDQGLLGSSGNPIVERDGVKVGLLGNERWVEIDLWHGRHLSGIVADIEDLQLGFLRRFHHVVVIGSRALHLIHLHERRVLVWSDHGVGLEYDVW